MLQFTGSRLPRHTLQLGSDSVCSTTFDSAQPNNAAGRPLLLGTVAATISIPSPMKQRTDTATASSFSSLFAVAVLAGGESRRMGFDKRQLEMGGQTLLARTLSLVEGLHLQILLAAPKEQAPPGLSVTVCEDGPGRGPAAGLLGAARLMPQATLLAVACDLPLLSLDLLQALLREATATACDIAVPIVGRQLHPLTATYTPRAIEHLKQRVGREQFGLKGLIKDAGHPLTAGLHTLPLTAKRLRMGAADLERQLANCNTPADWQRVQQLTAQAP